MRTTKKILRIANIIEEGKLGGPQVRMVRVAAALKGKAETAIIMPRENSEPFRQLCGEADLNLITLPISRITKEWRVALRYVFLFPYEIWRIRHVLRKGNFDLVHVSGGNWQYKGVIAAKLAGIPVLWHLNDTSMPGWVRRLFLLVQPLATAFVFASHRSREYYGDLVDGERPEAIVASTVNTDHFDPARAYLADQDIPSQPGIRPTIGTVANVNPIKGIETLIRAAGRLRERLPDLQVIVIGSIPANQVCYSKQLKALAQELGATMIWTGARKDVRPLLAQLDVYVCSSLAESSPVSVWEALAMRKAIVSADVADVARYVKDGVDGFNVPVEDDKAMADSIKQLLCNPVLRAEMGKRAREATRAFFPGSIAK